MCFLSLYCRFSSCIPEVVALHLFHASDIDCVRMIKKPAFIVTANYQK